MIPRVSFFIFFPYSISCYFDLGIWEKSTGEDGEDVLIARTNRIYQQYNDAIDKKRKVPKNELDWPWESFTISTPSFPCKVAVYALERNLHADCRFKPDECRSKHGVMCYGCRRDGRARIFGDFYPDRNNLNQFERIQLCADCCLLMTALPEGYYPVSFSKHQLFVHEEAKSKSRVQSDWDKAQRHMKLSNWTKK